MVVKTQLEMMDKISMKANDSVLEPLLAANPGGSRSCFSYGMREGEGKKKGN